MSLCFTLWNSQYVDRLFACIHIKNGYFGGLDFVYVFRFLASWSLLPFGWRLRLQATTAIELNLQQRRVIAASN